MVLVTILVIDMNKDIKQEIVKKQRRHKKFLDQNYLKDIQILKLSWNMEYMQD